VALIGNAKDEIRIIIFFKSFGVKKINQLVVTGNKLTNNFVHFITSSHGLDVACEPPVGPCCHWSYRDELKGD
jgi:hypothetical protein